MNLKTKLYYVFMFLFLSSVVFVNLKVYLHDFLNNRQSDADTHRELKYYKEASIILDLIVKDGTPVREQVIVNTLKAIDRNLPKYFPEGPFTRNDLLAIAWTESDFQQYETGSKGEKGIFQIMEENFKDHNIHSNKYDVNINTAIAMGVLADKYKQYPDYKKAIIAYNGVVNIGNGRWSEKYWNAVEKHKIVIDIALLNS